MLKSLATLGCIICFGAAPVSSSGLATARPYAGEQWVLKMARAPWGTRDSAGELVYNGKMWLLGGFTPKRVNDVWSSTDGEKWTLVTSAAPWAERNLLSTAVFRDKMWIIGGINLEGTRSFDDVWCSKNGKDWTRAVEHAPWAARGAATALVFQNRIWVMGGFEMADFRHFNDVWSSSDGVTWTEATESAPWSPRSAHTGVVYDGRMWVIGGGLYNHGYPFKTAADYADVWASSDGKTWRQTTPAAPWPGRHFHCSVVYDGKMWVIAGYHQRNFNELWYSTDGAAWTLAPVPAWPPRHEPSCLVFKDKLWVMGGFDNVIKTMYSDVWALEKVRP